MRRTLLSGAMMLSAMGAAKRYSDEEPDRQIELRLAAACRHDARLSGDSQERLRLRKVADLLSKEMGSHEAPAPEERGDPGQFVRRTCIDSLPADKIVIVVELLRVKIAMEHDPDRRLELAEVLCHLEGEEEPERSMRILIRPQKLVELALEASRAVNGGGQLV